MRLTRLTEAAHPGSPVPALAVRIADLPDRRRIAGAESDQLIDGALLASSRRQPDGSIEVTLYALPLTLGNDGTAAGLTHLVCQTIADQVAAQLGVAATELDPEAE